MSSDQIVAAFWYTIHAQNWDALADYFSTDAQIDWPNTNERFNVSEYIQANSHYPDDWKVVIDRIDSIAKDTIVTVVQVVQESDPVSFHATSFFEFEDDKIQKLTEYWGEDSPAPKWRQDLHLGTTII